MKKTISINIANTLYNIEEDAYAALDAYLSSVKAHFASNEDKDEILKDIEARIAERFSETPGAVITLTQVEKVIEDMGSVNQFDDMEKETEASASKRLYRDADNAVLAGVASGLGQYFGIDTTIVRLIFAISIFLGGLGIAIYIILWLVVPEAITAAQKLEMRGDPVNLSTVSSFVKEKIDGLGNKNSKKKASAVQSAVVGFFRGIARLIQNILFPAVRIILGSILLLTGFMIALSVTIGLGVGLFSLPGSYFSGPALTLFQGPFFYTGMIAIYFSILIPSLLVFFAGLRVIQRKRYLGKKVGFAFFGLWFIALAVSGIIISRFVMRSEEIVKTHPMFVTTTVDRTLEPFTKVDVGNAIRVKYVKGDTYTASITGRQYDIDTLSMNAVDGTLTIMRDKAEDPCRIFCPDRSVTITLTSPNITSVSVKDASRFEGDIVTQEFSLTALDASAARIGLTAQTLTVTVRDVSSATLTGTVDFQNITVTDASRYRGRDLQSQNAIATVSDASRVELFVEKTLTATARDAAAVRYLGDPVVIKEISDASSVRKLEQAPEAPEER